MRVDKEDQEARRLLGGSPVALVSVRWRNEVNIMPVAWSMPASVAPPLVALAIHPARYTHDMVKHSDEFALNIPGPRLLDHVHYFGVVSGTEINKLEASKLPTFLARQVNAPLLEHCVGWIECGVEDAIPFGDHTLFIGRVLAVQVDDEAFDETWKLTDEDLRPLHYLGGANYSTLGELLVAKVRTTTEGALDNPLPVEDLSPEDIERREEELFKRREAQVEADEKRAEGVAPEAGGGETDGEEPAPND
ncbi:MAG: flavin reductase family protein [Dehalococcoidia bacterium]